MEDGHDVSESGGYEAARGKNVLDQLLIPDAGGGGIPANWSVERLWPFLESVEQALPLDSPWPDSLRESLTRFTLAALRFTRPDGSSCFDVGVPAGRKRFLKRWSARLGDPAIDSVVARWLGGSELAFEAFPPLPACGGATRPVAMLRENWLRDGAWLAVSGQETSRCRVELGVNGRALLGWNWENGFGAGRTRGPVIWRTGPMADAVEWTFRTAKTRITRTAVLLRGRKLALLADQVDSLREEPASMRIDLLAGTATTPVEESRSLAVAGKTRAGSARVIPLALPAGAFATEKGALEARGDHLHLQQARSGNRSWLPLLVSWDGARDRKPPRWRSLTVSEKSRIVPPHRAFAARIAWSNGEHLVIYRSLGLPALRAFLGHQTTARFLIGRFTAEGSVVPLLQWNAEESP